MVGRITQKETREMPHVKIIPYGEAQKLFAMREADYYNDGMYGWNYNVYCVGANTLITGYRPIKAPQLERQVVSEYEAKAIALLEKYPMEAGYEETRLALETLLHKSGRENAE